MFAHNGDLPGIYRSEAMALDSHRPFGKSDSERAFCVLMERLAEGEVVAVRRGDLLELRQLPTD